MQRQTILICLEMLNSVNVPVSLEGASEKMASLVGAKADLEAELAELEA